MKRWTSSQAAACRCVVLPACLAVLLSLSSGLSSCPDPVRDQSPAAPAPQTDALHRCYEIELGRIEETYRLLDALAAEIWPGWTGYQDISFQVQFPNRTFLLLHPGQISAKGFDPWPGRSLRGKTVFLNRSEEVPFELKPPLIGGGGGSRGVRIRLRAREVEPGREKNFASDGQILLYVHELFHGFQNQTWKWDRAAMEGANPLSTPSADRAAWSEIESRVLLQAFQEEDKDRALEFLRRFLAARRMKWRDLNAPTIRLERHLTAAEGTATYAAIMAATLISKKGYVPALDRNLDPYFFDFGDSGAFIRRETVEGLTALSKNPFDALGFRYTGGAVMALLLDRFAPGWKTGFFENGRDLDSVLERASGSTPEAAAAESIAREYGYDEIYAEKSRLISSRDEAVRLVTGRAGKKFILDGAATKELFQIQPRGEEVRIEAALYFPRGIERLTLGDIEFIGAETPMSRPDLYIVEWVATDVPKGARGYELTCGKREGLTYFDAVFTTSGFTLKAPEIRIVEKDDSVRIILLSKVRRSAADSASAADAR